MSTHSPDKQGDPLDPQEQEKEKVLRIRNKQLKIWLTEREKQSIFSKAKRAGLSVSGYILLLNKGYVPKDSPPPDYYRMVRELRAIGNRSIRSLPVPTLRALFMLNGMHSSLQNSIKCCCHSGSRDEAGEDFPWQRRRYGRLKTI